MGMFVVAFYFVCRLWQSYEPTELMTVTEFLAWPLATVIMLSLLGIAVAGGMFVVPLYAFLTTRSKADETARTISVIGVPVVEQLLLSAAMCVVSAWLGMRLYRAEQNGSPL